jgi:hypothetical protein
LNRQDANPLFNITSDAEMIADEIRKNFKISLEELASKGETIIAPQSEISLSKALEQVQLLEANSKVTQFSKKSRPIS